MTDTNTNSAADRSLHDICRDAPMMNDTDAAVHSGFTNTQAQNSSANYPEEDGGTLTTSPIPSNATNPKSQLTKIETLKCWSVSTYKCTRQLMFEKLGKTSRTVDKDLETQIEFLRDIQKKYTHLLKLTKVLSSHFNHVVQTQQALSETFAELSQKSPELREEFKTNAETQKNLSRNGEMLLNALHFFLSSIRTLCDKTIEDTLTTVRQYEAARTEYDAYRTDLEMLAQMPHCDANTARIDAAQLSYLKYKEEFEKLRCDVKVKLKFLEENRIKVMQKQLQLLNSAVNAYFSGDSQALETTLKTFCVKNVRLLPAKSSVTWLEH